MNTKRYQTVNSLYTFKTEDRKLHMSLPLERNLKFQKDDVDFILETVEYLLSPETPENLNNHLKNKGYEVDDVNQLLNLLLDNNIIKEYIDPFSISTSLTNKQLAKFDRQMKNISLFPNNNYNDALIFQEKLSNSHILIVGVGGVGSYLSTGLAQVGVGTIDIIDFDYIELSNTSRQILYKEQDIGQLKIDVAVKKLKEISPDSSIVGHNIEVTSSQQLLENFKNVKFDIIAVCADKPVEEIYYILDEYSQKTGIPIIFGAPFAQTKIYLGPLLIPGVTKSYAQLIPKNIIDTSDDRIENINNHMQSEIIDTDNALAAKMMEVELLKYLNPNQEVAIKEKQIIIDKLSWNISHIDLNQ